MVRAISHIQEFYWIFNGFWYDIWKNALLKLRQNFKFYIFIVIFARLILYIGPRLEIRNNFTKQLSPPAIEDSLRFVFYHQTYDIFQFTEASLTLTLKIGIYRKRQCAILHSFLKGGRFLNSGEYSICHNNFYSAVRSLSTSYRNIFDSDKFRQIKIHTKVRRRCFRMDVWSMCFCQK